MEHFLTQLSLFNVLLSTLSCTSPDAVITRHSPTMIVPPLLTKLYRRPYFLLVRGLSHERLRFSWLLKKIFWINVRTADQVFPAYDKIKDKVDAIRHESQRESQTFPNAVNPEKLFAIEREAARDSLELPLEESDFVVGFVGSLKERHRVELLLRAVNNLDSSGEIKCIIVGEGPQRSKLESLVTELGIDDQVYFIGFIEHKEIHRYISASNVLYGVADPDNVSNPIKCYEYLACERPIITTKTAEFDFVEQENVGITCLKLSVTAIEDAIRTIQSKETEERTEMGKRGREFVLENHTWDQLAELVYEEFTDS